MWGGGGGGGVGREVGGNVERGEEGGRKRCGVVMKSGGEENVFLSPLCVCRALIGASIFISTVVLGTIILVVKIKPGDVGELHSDI